MRIRDHHQLGAFIAAIAPLGMLTAGCDGLGRFEPDNYDGEACVHGPGALSDLAPREGVDYVALRRWEDFGQEPIEAQITSEWGAACQTAVDRAACESALAALPLSTDPLAKDSGQLVALYDLLTTAGDDAEVIADRTALLDLLGTIDTPNEAALMIFEAGHRTTCGENNFRQEGSSYLFHGLRGTTCGSDAYHFDITVSPDGQVVKSDDEVIEHGDDNCAIGRRPCALASRMKRSRSAGAFFANAAHLEAASVYAFSQLARELRAHGAPRKLVRAARRARGDELRHARATAALARRFGAEPIPPAVGPQRIRSLYDVALDNATEGCVRETFGAVTAQVQVACARDPGVRRTMRRIAVEESRHAALSWAIDEWARDLVPPEQRRALARARQESVAELRREASLDETPEIIDAAGMPGAEAKQRLLRPLERMLFASA
jgi:hypothetical protein